MTSLTDPPLPGPELARESLRGGASWSGILRRHQGLRLIDIEGRACVAMLAFRAAQPLERYNMPDTLKAQHTAFLTAGRVLMSDMGRALLSVVGDTCGWHDTITGHQDAGEARAAFGEGTYQALRNDRVRNTRDNLLVELGRHGLGERDLHPNVNWFARVRAGHSGALQWDPGSRPGAHVDLRAETDVLVVLSNTPHPLDPRRPYAPPPVDLAWWRAAPPGPDDVCRTSRPEAGRALALVEADHG